MNANSLALRDPAYAALVGATDDSDFGSEAEFGGSADQLGLYYGYNPANVGWDAPGAEGFFGQEGFFGYNIGADAPAAAPAAGAPSHQQLVAMWHANAAKAAHTARRAGLLNPNEHSTKKVERYSLSLNHDITVGTPGTFTLTDSPDTELRAQRITTNVDNAGFVLIAGIKVANVNVTQGGSIDAQQLQSTSWGMQYDIPTLSPANKVTVTGSNSSKTPSGFQTSDTFTLVVTFLGPASMAG